MKKFLSLTLSTLMLFSVLGASLPAFAEETETIENDVFDYYDELDEVQVEPFGVLWDSPLADRTDYDDALNAPIMDEIDPETNLPYPTPNDLIDTSESSDYTFHLNQITVANGGDSGGFKNVINFGASSQNRNYLLSQITSDYSSRLTHSGTVDAIMEGACSDGEYIYYSICVRESYRVGSIYEAVDIGNVITAGKFIGNTFVSQSLITDIDEPKLRELDHANDVTYNSLTNQLVFACGGVTTHQYVATVNADYFKNPADVQGTTTLDFDRIPITGQISCISYDDYQNKYYASVTGENYFLAMYDEDFNLEGIIKDQLYNVSSGSNITVSVQNMICDEHYLYLSYYIRPKKQKELTSDIEPANVDDIPLQNVIIVLDKKGKLIKEINFDIPKITHNGKLVFYEIENIIFHNDKIFVGFNFYYMHATTGNRKADYYYYDLTDQFFTVQYCQDDNVSTHIASPEKAVQHIVYDSTGQYPTVTYSNHFAKDGYLFKGWSLYAKDYDKWYYQNGSTKLWASEAEGIANNYTKVIYPENQKVARTVGAGKTVLFCAEWEATDKFFVSFESNGGSGTIADMEATYGAETNQLPGSSSGINKANRTLQGWNAYCVETGMWFYTNGDGSFKHWYKECNQPAGMTKTKYLLGQKIVATVPKGCHVVFYAVWDEFYVYYNANKKSVNATSLNNFIKQSYQIGISTNRLKSISNSHVDENVSTNQFHAFRADKQFWRCVVNGTNQWVLDSQSQGYNKSIYTTNTAISKTATESERVVFYAIW